jgi:serine/threonine-protein kinase
MDSTTYLKRYQLTVGANGSPVALHRGPSGVTFRAEDIETDQPVALKLMPTYSFELAELQQLETEARAAQNVDHPNVARLYDFGFAGTDVVFVTELLDGGTTLDAWVSEHGPLPAAAVLRIASQVVAGLSAAAFHSVLHRAIQPANLMIVPGQTPDGEWPFVKVLNFGGVPPTLSNSAVSLGQGAPSAQFAAPEQLEGKPVDFPSELYSLGCTMWFLLTGVLPTPGAVDKGGRIPKPLRPLLARLVAADPTQRPQDPVRLQDELADCLARIEHRAPITRKFAAPVGVVADPAPVAVAAETPSIAVPHERLTPQTALLKPLALAAAVLLLAGIVALALPYVRSNKTAEKPIGVPVGVPDGSGAAVAQTSDNAAPAANGAQATTAQETAPAASTVASNSNRASDTSAAAASANTNSAAAQPEATAPAVVSILPPAPGESPANDMTTPAAANANAQPATVAVNNTSSNNAEAEPAPPAEGPASNTNVAAANAQPANEVAQSAPARSKRSAATQPSERVPNTVASRKSATAEKPQEEAAPTPKATPKRAARIARNDDANNDDATHADARKAQPAEDAFASAPPVPRGSKRAKFLGTTPEGDLIFGLPSEQRGFVAPPGTSAAERRRARRTQITDAPAAAEALPAEPVEHGDDDE